MVDGAGPSSTRRRVRTWPIAGALLVAGVVAGGPRDAAAASAGTHSPTTPLPATGPLTEPPIPHVVATAAARPPAPTIAPPEAAAPSPVLGPVDHVAFLGDSLIADLRLLVPDAVPNDVVPEIAAALQNTTAVGDVHVENLGRPGQSLVFVREDFRRHDPGITTLRAAVHTFFARRPIDERPQLTVIATTGIDVNVMPGLPIQVLAPILVDALQKVVDDLAELGIQAVVLPIFPVSDALYDRHVGADRDTAARIDHVNARLADSALPLLFAGFTGLDLDGEPGGDPAFYTRFSDDHPDDGIHPGAAGRRAYVDNVLGALLPLLVAANDPERPEPAVPPEADGA